MDVREYYALLLDRYRRLSYEIAELQRRRDELAYELDSLAKQLVGKAVARSPKRDDDASFDEHV